MITMEVISCLMTCTEKNIMYNIHPIHVNGCADWSLLPKLWKGIIQSLTKFLTRKQKMVKKISRYLCIKRKNQCFENRSLSAVIVQLESILEIQKYLFSCKLQFNYSKEQKYILVQNLKRLI
ncbi:hypothetical protein V8G54_020964 [Vigna mungo]|uniref:Uncharacterized protein n=1 Tax=Vigna mungo TaxID=3915 RepID=A0AAQ3NFB0_VIGMU